MLKVLINLEKSLRMFEAQFFLSDREFLRGHFFSSFLVLHTSDRRFQIPHGEIHQNSV